MSAPSSTRDAVADSFDLGTYAETAAASVTPEQVEQIATRVVREATSAIITQVTTAVADQVVTQLAAMSATTAGGAASQAAPAAPLTDAIPEAASQPKARLAAGKVASFARDRRKMVGVAAVLVALVCGWLALHPAPTGVKAAVAQTQTPRLAVASALTEALAWRDSGKAMADFSSQTPGVSAIAGPSTIIVVAGSGSTCWRAAVLDKDASIQPERDTTGESCNPERLAEADKTLG